jgi:hypothetical protein
MTLQNFGHGSLAGGPIMLQMGWPHDPAKNFARWPHDPANRQACRRYVKNLSADRVLAKQRIIDWLKPSAPTRPPTWPTRIRRVFGCRVDRPLAETMVTFIMWRNELSHLGRRRYAVEWNGTDLGEVMVAWLLASVVLGVRLGEASFRRRP